MDNLNNKKLKGYISYKKKGSHFNMEKVSIIIPFNNGQKYLKRCLDNISKQNYENYEIILIDDYSMDNSQEIAKEYDKVKYYYTNEKTIGVGNARNLGIEKAHGDYIMFVDVDDTIDENLLINMKQYIDKDIEMIKYKMKIVKGNKKIFTNGKSFDSTDGEDAFNKLCSNDKYLDSPCLYLIKKEALDRNSLRFEKNMYHEDFGLIPQLIVNAKSFVSTDFYGYNYYQTDNSIMRNNDYLKSLKKMDDKIKHYENLKNNLIYFNLKKITKEKLLTYYTNSIIISIQGLNSEDRRLYEKLLKKKRIIDNFKVSTFKQLLKKALLFYNFNLYFKVRKLFKEM